MQQQTRTIEDRQTVEEFDQFLQWAGSPDHPGPFLSLATDWYCGLLTVEEGRRIETDQELARFLSNT